MYNINNAFYLKLWDGNSQSYIEYFYNIQELIEYISYNFYMKKEPFKNEYKISNFFIEHCACHPNDKLSNSKRYYQVFDNNNRIINVNDFWEEALNLRLSRGGFFENYPKGEADWIMKRLMNRLYPFEFTQSIKGKKNIRFRAEPVPKTGRRIKYGILFRRPRTLRELKAFTNPEMRQFNRRGRKNIPTYWDDNYRCCQRSWKAQSKARHQWQREGKV